MPIDKDTRRDLRGLAHHLNPVVTVAEKGLTENVLAEIERALSDHELIKVKLAIADRDVRAGVRAAICGHTGAESVADIGKVAVLFKPNPSAKPHLSNLQRAYGTVPAKAPSRRAGGSADAKKPRERKPQVQKATHRPGRGPADHAQD